MFSQCPSVKAWAEGLRRQWGGDPLAEEPDKLQALNAFCELVSEGPDAIVGRCFRTRRSDGERVLSDKWRMHYAQKVRAFQALRGARPASAVLSFLIHNGIFIQA